MKTQIQILIFCLILFAGSGCRVFFPNAMFEVPEDYEYVDLDTVPAPEYVINPGDLINLQVYSNEGYGNVQTIVPTFQRGTGQSQANQFKYLVKHDGNVKLPIIGDFYVQGMSVPQAQVAVAEAYSEFYKDPLVFIEVTNRRVYVYTGGSESGKVIFLTNENMTLLEVITLAGGIPEKGKATEIKLIREDSSGTKIDLIDFSTIEGYDDGNLIVQADDIVYIETTRKLAPAILREISPVLGIIGSLTSLISVYLLIMNTNGG